MMVHRDRLIVLNFMTPPPPFSNVTPNSNGFLSTSANAEELTSVPINRGGQDVTLSSFLDDTGELNTYPNDFLKGLLVLSGCAVWSCLLLIIYCCSTSTFGWTKIPNSSELSTATNVTWVKVCRGGPPCYRHFYLPQIKSFFFIRK